MPIFLTYLFQFNTVGKGNNRNNLKKKYMNTYFNMQCTTCILNTDDMMLQCQ